MPVVVPERPSASPLLSDDLGAHGNQVALVTAEESITYAELDERVRDLVVRLGPARRLVLLGAGNAIEPIVAYLAALRGGHPVLLVPGDNDDSIRVLAAAYDPDVVINARNGWDIEERRTESAHQLHPDLALLLSTSGSTGSPKLVRLSRQNLLANAESIAQYLGITKDHRAATTLPMQYCYGLSVINSHLHSGAGLVLTELSVVDRCFWDLFTAAGATSFAGVPHTFELLNRAGFASMSLPTLRHVTQAGGRMNPETVCRYAALGEREGWEFFVMYGQTEATARMAYLPPALATSRPETIGIPIPGGDFTIDAPDDDGVGELVYRGANVMLGYAEHPRDLALGASIEELRTGDLARQTPEGLYQVMGRTSRFIKLFGLRIDLDHVERLVAQHGLAAMCTGDDNNVMLAVEAGADVAGIKRLVSNYLGLPHRRVLVVEFDELPRLSNGKPDHLSVRRRAAEAHDAPRTTTIRKPESPPSDHRAAVRAGFSEVLDTDASDEDSFVSLGGDSLSYVEMSLRLEEILGFLPRDWHMTPIGQLSPSRTRSRLVRQTETSAVLRGVAILLIVGTHTTLWHLPGGAHALLAVAGHNFARFQLRSANKVSSIARIALPAMCWIGIVAATGDRYSWPSALLVNGQLGAPDALWGYWYIEALVQILIPLSLIFGISGVRRLESRWPFSVALAVVLMALAVRFDVLALEVAHYRTSRPHEVLWLFAIGWAAARATGPAGRLLVSMLAIAAVPGFFGEPQREAIVIGGILLMTWLPTISLPWPLNRLVGTVGGASLYIYLTHWQVYPPLSRLHGPALATAGSIAAGVAIWLVARRMGGLFEGLLARARTQLPVFGRLAMPRRQPEGIPGTVALSDRHPGGSPDGSCSARTSSSPTRTLRRARCQGVVVATSPAPNGPPRR